MPPKKRKTEAERHAARRVYQRARYAQRKKEEPEYLQRLASQRYAREKGKFDREEPSLSPPIVVVSAQVDTAVATNQTAAHPDTQQLTIEKPAISTPKKVSGRGRYKKNRTEDELLEAKENQKARWREYTAARKAKDPVAFRNNQSRWKRDKYAKKKAADPVGLKEHNRLRAKAAVVSNSSLVHGSNGEVGPEQNLMHSVGPVAAVIEGGVIDESKLQGTNAVLPQFLAALTDLDEDTCYGDCLLGCPSCSLVADIIYRKIS